MYSMQACTFAELVLKASGRTGSSAMHFWTCFETFQLTYTRLTSSESVLLFSVNIDIFASKLMGEWSIKLKIESVN